MSIQKKILNNQIVLITEPIATIKTVAIGFWFPIGSRFEEPGQRGISHFVEHMLFKGTSQKSSFDIACSFDKVGGYINAFTEREVVCLHGTVPANYAEYALEIMCSMVSDSVFAENELEKEREVIINEIITSQDDPEEAAADVLYDALFEDALFSDTIAGSVRDVKKLKREEIIAWYQKYIKNGSLLVTISGNFDKNLVEKPLLTLTQRQNTYNFLLNKISQNHFETNKGLFTQKAPFQQNQIFAVFAFTKVLSEKESNAWTLLNAIIGDSMSSRLFQRLREKNGFCYSVYSYFNVFADYGFWCTYCSVAKKNTAFLIQELQTELSSLFEKGVSHEELIVAKEHIKGEEIIASEDVESRMKRLARLYFSNYEIITFEEYIERIQKVSVEEINLEIKKHLQKQNEMLLIYGCKNDHKLRKCFK